MSSPATTSTELYYQSPVPWTPHVGQKKAVKFLLEHAAAALLADPGIGKSSIVLGAFKVLKKKGLANKMLVIAPLKVAHLVWPYEVKKWIDFNGFTVEVLHGSKKDEALRREADIYVINYEGLDWLMGAEKRTDGRGRVSVQIDLSRFRALGFDTLVMDELTKMKNTQSGRFKTMKAALNTFGRRWGLTGTPVPNGLIDLFGQMYVLDQGRALGQYVTHYRQKYFIPSHDGFDWHLRKGADKEIFERIEPTALRLDADDYIDMPEVVMNRIMFDLPPKIRQIYDALEEEMITKIDDNLIVASNAASASMKCRQVCNGGLYLDPTVLELIGDKLPKLGAKRDHLDLHQEKSDLLEDLVNELQGSPLLVAYDFNHDLDRLLGRFGKDTPFLGGGVNAKRAKDIEGAWNRGEIPLLFGHPQSIGHGLNLQQAGNHVCWYSLTFNFELYDQFIRRVWRQGNKRERVFVHHLLARNTVDEVMWHAIQGKDKTQTNFLEMLRSRK